MSDTALSCSNNRFPFKFHMEKENIWSLRFFGWPQRPHNNPKMTQKMI